MSNPPLYQLYAPTDSFSDADLLRVAASILVS